MDQKQTQFSLIADYESDSDEGESSPIAITNCDFLNLNQEDQALVRNIYETDHADLTSSVSHQETSTEEANASENNPSESSVAPIAASHQSEKRTKYALEENQLSPSMLALLKEVKVFFTRPNSLERITSAVALSTIDKAKERIRCK